MSFLLEKNRRRYFLIVGNFHNANAEGMVNGTIATDKGFPSRKEILKFLLEVVLEKADKSFGPFEEKHLCITNIIEFKSKQDYQDYHESTD